MRVLQPGIALDFETVVIYSSRSSSYSTNAFILSLSIKDLIFIRKNPPAQFFHYRKDVLRSVSHSNTCFFETK